MAYSVLLTIESNDKFIFDLPDPSVLSEVSRLSMSTFVSASSSWEDASDVCWAGRILRSGHVLRIASSKWQLFTECTQQPGKNLQTKTIQNWPSFLFAP